MSTIESWMDLTACPFHRLTVPNGIDMNNYIAINWGKINDIYKYNTDTDKWNKIDGCNAALDVKKHLWFSAALDVKKHLLYLSNKYYVTQIQLNSGNIIFKNTNNIETNYPSRSSKSIILNDSLFIIGGYYNKLILKWNSESETVTKFSDMYNKMRIGIFGLINNHKNNCLLLFGGCNGNNDESVDYILEFNMNTKQWNKLEVTLPQKMSYISCTMAINNKYVLLFGGWDGERCYDDIYIYSLKHKTIRQSKMKCPSKSVFEAITVNNNIKDEKLTFGYIRKEWKICNINNYFLPYYLLKLIHSYYLNEYVYLLDKRTKKHCKISTLHIV